MDTPLILRAYVEREHVRLPLPRMSERYAGTGGGRTRSCRNRFARLVRNVQALPQDMKRERLSCGNGDLVVAPSLVLTNLRKRVHEVAWCQHPQHEILSTQLPARKSAAEPADATYCHLGHLGSMGRY